VSKEDSELPIVTAIFHTILFAYQKAIRDILGSGQAIFAQPVMETIKKISEEYQIELIKGKA